MSLGLQPASLEARILLMEERIKQVEKYINRAHQDIDVTPLQFQLEQVKSNMRELEQQLKHRQPESGSKIRFREQGMKVVMDDLAESIESLLAEIIAQRSTTVIDEI